MVKIKIQKSDFIEVLKDQPGLTKRIVLNDQDRIIVSYRDKNERLVLLSEKQFDKSRVKYFVYV